jgi:hypothetical protein
MHDQKDNDVIKMEKKTITFLFLGGNCDYNEGLSVRNKPPALEIKQLRHVVEPDIKISSRRHSNEIHWVAPNWRMMYKRHEGASQSFSTLIEETTRRLVANKRQKKL